MGLCCVWRTTKQDLYKCLALFKYVSRELICCSNGQMGVLIRSALFSFWWYRQIRLQWLTHLSWHELRAKTTACIKRNRFFKTLQSQDKNLTETYRPHWNEQETCLIFLIQCNGASLQTSFPVDRALMIFPGVEWVNILSIPKTAHRYTVFYPFFAQIYPEADNLA